MADVPKGFKLVPIEPTVAMMNAVTDDMRGKAPWIERSGTISWERANHNVIYRAMVSAAPEPERKENSSFVPVLETGTVVPDTRAIDDAPRYTTKRLHDEIRKAREYGRQVALEQAAGLARSIKAPKSIGRDHGRHHEAGAQSAARAIEALIGKPA